MKYTISALFAVSTMAALVTAPTSFAGTHKRASAPVVIQMPAIPDGSNWSRAPFPSERPQNDVTPPNGEAFDQNIPPNTPATTPEPFAPPPPAVAIFRPRVAPSEMPTGREAVSASVGLDAAQLVPSIRNSSYGTRDDLVDSLRVRVRRSEESVAAFARTESEMSEQGRSQFQALRADVKARDKALERSLRAAVDASAAGWDSARAQLAADYDAYAAAVARMDAAVVVPPAR